MPFFKKSTKSLRNRLKNEEIDGFLHLRHESGAKAIMFEYGLENRWLGIAFQEGSLD